MVATSNRSVALTDVFGIDSENATDLERKITTLQLLEDIVSRLSLLLNIFVTGSNCSPETVDINCSYLDSFAMELLKQAIVTRNAAVLRVPYYLPLESAKFCLLDSCNMSIIQFSPIRPQKNSTLANLLCSFNFLINWWLSSLLVDRRWFPELCLTRILKHLPTEHQA